MCVQIMILCQFKKFKGSANAYSTNDLFLETDNEDLKDAKDEVKSSLPPITNLKRWQWWLLVFLNIGFLLIGQGVAVLLLRSYYEKGGHCNWAATLAQNAGFPFLFIPFILFPSIKEPSTKCPRIVLMLIYVGLGALFACGNLMHSVGLEYLSTSTYSCICATQLVFSAVFSFFINSQKCTILILNSIIVLTLSAILVGVSGHPAKQVSQAKYTLGFVATIGASALYALLLSLTQLSFQKIIKKETFAVVLELQICTSIVASCVSLAGLFASGEWRLLEGEVMNFHDGSLSYAMTLILTAIAWQICSVGAVGLIFVVSSLFSNVVSTLALCLSPLAAAIAFDHSLKGAKIVAVLMGIWGFTTYVYQSCLDDHEAKNKHTDDKPPECSC
ncbi:putative purine permease, plant [Helianthus annuus]|uniref:Probable purine permease n=1 Tax=Helianthus annuus TaxID=4232 RepID=A0A9K3GVN0_HELAN|nr:putative purine permease, plant [Helianthus annuus]KAJ0633551.1 putative purine permease, plant [Helianthus annuus]KAJ0637364.1 putative purine permease, plant [Helianthus annuus]KAJ0814680.1 putative purine permease, plant [Helianthus annuus]